MVFDEREARLRVRPYDFVDACVQQVGGIEQRTEEMDDAAAVEK
jgi:hypothetical protein